MKLLEVNNLEKEFHKSDKSVIRVLSNISFQIEKGECFVIIGPNGSGKTTILRILGLLDKPSKGKITLHGRDLGVISRKEKVNIRRKFSFVRQKPVVRNASVLNNIQYGLKIRGMKYEEYHDKVNEIIEIVGLKGMEHKNARTLSGGEMQRVAIAMNFIINPEIYLLDEVSANLDPMNIKLLDEFITKIKRDKEKTIIMSTHDPLEAIKYADRIAVLSNGEFTQIGLPNEIFTAPKDEFTAIFVGYENIFPGIAKIDESTGLNQVQINDLIVTASSQVVGEVKVCIRPESIGIVKNPPKNTSYRNTFKGQIENIRELGNICHVLVKCGSEKFLTTITELSKKNLELKIGSEVFINFKATDVKIL
ncbi:MAG: ABC transporter ATP-binding protein [Candidatus Lokiarchaeota archaeon]|nr:ABC transporter ATP-binding protein [Candidatus Lokiarchaeota archaeon]